MAMAPRCDVIVVIGSANSSNTRALEKLATQAGTQRVFRVNSADELPGRPHRHGRCHRGASAPGGARRAVIARLAPRHGVERSTSRTRTSTSLPAQHPRAPGCDRHRGATMLGGDPSRSATFDDHRLAASDVLEILHV
jgi:4-hydroxy-3-methylbut-2-enyl diphosphate reductase